MISAQTIEKMKQFEHIAVVCLAVFVVVFGLYAGAKLDTISPTGMFSIEKQQCIEEWFCTDWGSCNPESGSMLQGIQERECLDFNSCSTVLEKPETSRNCSVISSLSQITMHAVLPQQQDDDVLLISLYLLSLATLIIIISYLAIACFGEKPAGATMLAFAFWIAMIGVPLATYYSATRGRHLIGVYLSFGVSLAAMLLLAIWKPWLPPKVREVSHVNKVLHRHSQLNREKYHDLRENKEERQAGFRNFIERMKSRRADREFIVKGVEKDSLERINSSIHSIDRKERVSETLASVKQAIARREQRLAEMNRKIDGWARKRRKNQEVIEALRKYGQQ